MENTTYDDWQSVFKTGNDYEAELVCDRLRDADIPAVVLNKRDHAIGVTHGDLAQIKVLVPANRQEDALALLNQRPLTDAELTEAALAASPFDDSGEEDDAQPADEEDLS